MDRRFELNCMTNRSISESVIKPEEIVQLAVEKGLAGIAVTDFYSVDSWFRAKHGKNSAGIKLIFGVQIRLEIDNDNKDKVIVTLLAKNEVGKRNIFKLMSLTDIKEKGARDWVSLEELNTYRKGILVGWGYRNNYLSVGSCDAERDYIKDILGFSKDVVNYYEVSSPLYSSGSGLEGINKDIIEWVIACAEDAKKPVVAVSGAGYGGNGDEDAYRILQRSNNYVFESFGMRQPASTMYPLDNADNHLRSTVEMLETFAYLGEEKAREIVLDNTKKIADQISFDGLELMKDIRFNSACDKKNLCVICYKRAHQLYGKDLPGEVEKRLINELDIICSASYESYYLIEKEIVENSGIGNLHSLRGSAANSFVAFLCGISRINPLQPHYRCADGHYSEFHIKPEKIKAGCLLPEKRCPKCGKKLIGDGFNLPAEFFIGTKNNAIMPDFDLNVCAEYKENIENHLKHVYGKDCVIHVGTPRHIGTYEAQNAIRAYTRATEKAFDDLQKERLVSLLSDCVDATKGLHPSKLIVVPSIYGNITDHFPTIDYYGKIISNADWSDLDGNVVDIDVFSSLSLDLLNVLQKKTGVLVEEIPISDISLQRLLISDESGKYLLNGVIDDLYKETVRNILSMGKDYHFDDLVKMIGLSHDLGAWMDNGKVLVEKGIPFSDIIANREDCYDFFMSHGIDERVAYRLAQRIRKGLRPVRKQDDEIMKNAGIPEWYINSCRKIRYLYPRGAAISEAMLIWRLLYYKRHYTDIFYNCFIDLWADDQLKSVVRKGTDAIYRYIERIRDSRESMSGDVNHANDDPPEIKQERDCWILETAIEMFESRYNYL